MKLTLGSQWEEFINEKLKSGEYKTASEVICDGLRLLVKEALLQKISVNSPEELEKKLLAALEELDAGQGIDGEKVFADLRQRSKARREGV